MSTNKRIRRTAAGTVVALVVLGGGALAYASAQPSRATLDLAGQDAVATAVSAAGQDTGTGTGTATTPGAAGAPGAPGSVRECVRQHRAAKDKAGVAECLKGLKGARAVLRGAVHGDLIVKNDAGTFETVTFDRGKVTAKDAGHISLDRPDGVKVDVKVDANTTYKGVANLDQVQTGRPAVVVSKDGTARVVAQRTPKAAGPTG